MEYVYCKYSRGGNILKDQEKWLSDLGIRLKTEREKRGLTQQALADKAGTKQDYIAQIERGTRNPSLRTFMNILSGLDISADYLIYGVTGEKKDALEGIIDDFVSFLSRRNVADVAHYYEIVQFMSKYIDSDGSKS